MRKLRLIGIGSLAQRLGGQELGEAGWNQVSSFFLHESFCLDIFHGAQRSFCFDFNPSKGAQVPSFLYLSVLPLSQQISSQPMLGVGGLAES